MNGKKAKEQRKQDPVAYTVMIDVMKDGTVQVRQFPNVPKIALGVLLNATGAVADYFIKAAAMGDAKNIIPAGPQLVGPDGKKVN